MEEQGSIGVGVPQEVEKRQREQARAHARFTRQRKQELIDKLQNQCTELLNHRLETELKAQRGARRARLLKQKMLQLLDLWADSGGTEVKCVDVAEFERNHLLDPQVRALLPVCCRDPQHHSQPSNHQQTMIVDTHENSFDSKNIQGSGQEQVELGSSSLKLQKNENIQSLAENEDNRKEPSISLLRAVGDWSTQRSLVGADALRQGMASLSLQPERLGVVDATGKPLQLRFIIEVSVDSMFAASNAAMCPFWYKSYNARRCGASREVKLRAMLYCEYTGGDTNETNVKASNQFNDDDDAKHPSVSDWNKAMDETCDSSTVPSFQNHQQQQINQSFPPPGKNDTVLELPIEHLETESAESAHAAAISGARVVYDRAAWSREVSSAFAWDLPTLRRDAILPTNLHQALAAMALDGNVKPMLLTSIQSPRKILRVSERYCELTGYHPRELLGNALMWLDPPSAGHRSRLLELVDDLKHGHPLMAMMQHPTNLPSTKKGGPLFDQNGLYTFTHAYPLCDDAGLQAGLLQGFSQKVNNGTDVSNNQKNTDHDAPGKNNYHTSNEETRIKINPSIDNVDDSGDATTATRPRILGSVSATQPTTHVLWVLREPPEPKVAPCVSSLLELAVRVARALLVELRHEDTAFCADMFDLLDSVLVQDSDAMNKSPPSMGRSLSSTTLQMQQHSSSSSSSQQHQHNVGLYGGAELPGADFLGQIVINDDGKSQNSSTTNNINGSNYPIPLSLKERVAEARERHVVLTMWELYKQTRIRWGKVASLTESQKQVTKSIGTIWSHFFAQVREAGAGEPFASFIERAKHYGVDRRDENVSFILRRFASLALNFHRDWVSNGKINDAIPQDRIQEVERAVDVYTKVIDTWPKYAEAWNRRARAYFLLGNYVKAAQDLNQALELQPDNPSAWVGKMLVSMKQHEYAPALEAYKHAIKLNPALDIGYRAAEL